MYTLIFMSEMWGCNQIWHWCCIVGHKRCELIPEGLVTELAGVRQASTSFLLTTCGHAEVTAAIGHLWGWRHVFAGGWGRHPREARWVIIAIWQRGRQKVFKNEFSSKKGKEKRRNHKSFFCTQLHNYKERDRRAQTEKVGVKPGALEWLRRSYIFLGRQKAVDAHGSLNHKKRGYKQKNKHIYPGYTHTHTHIKEENEDGRDKEREWNRREKHTPAAATSK